MNMRYVVLCFAALFGLCAHAASVPALSCAESDPVKEILERVKPKSGDIVLVSFIVPGECIKCNLALNSAYSWLASRLPKGKKVKLVGYIHCNREVELKGYAEDYPMYDVLLMDDGFRRAQCRVSADTRVIVLDHLGKVLGRINDEEYFNHVHAALQRILKLE